jgi:hypothetical protein
MLVALAATHKVFFALYLRARALARRCPVALPFLDAADPEALPPSQCVEAKVLVLPDPSTRRSPT